MNVYTELNLQDMQDFTKQFDFGALKSFQGVEAGVENTTYFVSFDQAETVLQIFEEQGFDEIPFFIELNRRLSEDHVPVATPLANRSGDRLFTIREAGCFISAHSGINNFPDLCRGVRTNG